MPPRIRKHSSNEHCPDCIDGLAEIGTRPEGKGHLPMYGPCPYCEQGARLEFPMQGRPLWGEEGYWQGRPHTITPPAKSGRHTSATENLMRCKLLFRRWAGEDVDPLEGIGLPERERIRVLAERMKS